LENVLAINPGNSRARSGLDFLNRQNPPPVPPAGPDPANEPPVVSSAVMGMAAASAVSAVPVADSPTSVEWATSDEPVDDSGWHAAPAPPTEAYDEWVSGLQLGAPQTVPVPRSDPFASPGSGSSPFYGTDDDLNDLTTGTGLFDNEDAFGAGAAFAVAATMPSSAPLPASSAISFRPPPADEAMPADGPGLGSAGAANAVSPAPRTATGLADLTIEADDIVVPENEDALFPQIPREIKATRMPGTNEGVPILLRVAVILLAVLTFGSALLFFWKAI
jgi:hypothetical protein